MHAYIPTVLGAVLVEVLIVLAGISIVIIVAYGYYLNYLARRAAAMAGPCGLFTDSIFPNECLGTCPPGQRCRVTATRIYWIGWFAFRGWPPRQAAACACAPWPMVTPGGAPVPLPGGTGTSPGSPSDIAPIGSETHPH